MSPSTAVCAQQHRIARSTLALPPTVEGGLTRVAAPFADTSFLVGAQLAVEPMRRGLPHRVTPEAHTLRRRRRSPLVRRDFSTQGVSFVLAVCFVGRVPRGRIPLSSRCYSVFTACIRWSDGREHDSRLCDVVAEPSKGTSIQHSCDPFRRFESSH
ncbi:unnamed protein product, partial [Ectocarpus sp. 12 AP-2014]